MNKVFLHSKNDELKYIQHFYYLLLIFALFGIYKNGIIPYQNNLITLINVFKPLFLVVISVGTSYVFSLLFKEKFFSYRLICNTLISLLVMPNISYLIYAIILIVLNLIYHFIRFNIPSFYMVITSIVLMVMNNYSYLNGYEATHSLKYGFLDYLFGKGYGGIGNTLLFLTVLLAIVYICNKQYKKHIVISFMIAHVLLSIIYCFITKDLSIGNIINNNVLFGIVFVATLPLYSPYTRGGCYLYGVILAIICFASSFWDINLGFYIGISLLSILSKVLDKPFVR